MKATSDITLAIARIRQIDGDFADDVAGRRRALEHFRDEYCVEYMIGRLGRDPVYHKLSSSELRTLARRIRYLPYHRRDAQNQEARRTADEERIIGAARVSWHNLLKDSGVPPPRLFARRPSFNSLQGSATRVRNLEKFQSRPDEGSVVIRNYIAIHAKHLLEICERANLINSELVETGLRRQIRRLVATCES